MCAGPEIMMAAGNLMQGVSAWQHGRTAEAMARTDAMTTRDTAAQQAEVILRATGRRRAEARAATAASGARVDEFSLRNEQEILQAGETDAAMAILSGERQARELELGGKLQRKAGQSQLVGSLFGSAATLSGWRGTTGAGAGVR